MKIFFELHLTTNDEKLIKQMRSKLHNEECTIREKMRLLQKENENKMAAMQRNMNILQTENARLKRELATKKGSEAKSR